MQATPQYVRSIWISDLHLGTKHARTSALLDFFQAYESRYLFLVGDIFDGWSLSRSWYWDQSHNDVIQKILRKSRKGTCVTYIPGNHDEFVRDYEGLSLGNIRIRNEAVHVLLDGRKLLVVHGDCFDGILRYARWLQLTGAVAYQMALNVNRLLNVARHWCRLPYWSLSSFLKAKTKKAVQYVAEFEELVAGEALRRRVDGVVCGHIHKAEMRQIGSVQYFNCGDWVESCTALIEKLDGGLEIISFVPGMRPGSLQKELFESGGDGQIGRNPSLSGEATPSASGKAS